MQRRNSMMKMFAGAGLLLMLPATALAQESAQPLELTDTIELGYRTDAPPFSSLVDKKLVGYSADLCIEVVQHLVDAFEKDAIDATLTKATAGTRFDLITSGEIDILCGATTHTLERRYFMGFSIPIFLDGVGFAISEKADPEIIDLVAVELTTDELKTAPALNGRKLGVLENTTTEEFLAQTGIDGLADTKVQVFADHRDALDAVAAGSIDVYFASGGILKGLIAQENRPLVVSKSRLTHEPIALGLARDNPDLALVVDEALSNLYLNGSIIGIYEKHFGPAGPEVEAYFRGVALR